MDDKNKNPAPAVHNVLFICTANSARSILAEGLMNHLGRGRFKAWSAGSHPRGAVQPLALATLEWLDIPTQGFASKSWDAFARPDAPGMDFVFTVCDQAAGEVCPVWPGQPITAHWGVADPVAADGPDEVRGKAYRDAALTLKRRIELMLALPIEQLDALSLRRQLADIGTR